MVDHLVDYFNRVGGSSIADVLDDDELFGYVPLVGKDRHCCGLEEGLNVVESKVGDYFVGVVDVLGN